MGSHPLMDFYFSVTVYGRSNLMAARSFFIQVATSKTMMGIYVIKLELGMMGYIYSSKGIVDGYILRDS
jgi:hypothetical protein